MTFLATYTNAMQRALLSLSLALALGAPCLQAQRASAGPFMMSGHGLSVEVFPQLEERLVYERPAGNNAIAPPSQATCNLAVDFAAFFASLPANVDVDAVSIGMDWIPTDKFGLYKEPPDPGWAATTFSVKEGTVATGVIAQEDLELDDNTGDLFSYVFPGSELPGAAIDVVQRAQNSTEMGVWNPYLLDNREMNGHDMFMDDCNAGERFRAGLVEAPTMYFSLRHGGELMQLPSSWWGGASMWSGGTVLKTKWNPVARAWGPVSPFLTYMDLGHARTHELDAVSVDIVQGYVVYSLDASAMAPSQLLFYNVGTGFGAPFRIRYGMSEVFVCARLGMGATSDDIDAVCDLDPGQPRLYPPTAMPFPSDRMVGQPLEDPLSWAPLAPSYRVTGAAQAGTGSVSVGVAGYPPDGANYGWVILGIGDGLGGVPFSVLGPFQHEFELGVYSVSFPVPDAAFLGVELGTRWLVANNALTSIDLTHPVRVRL
ncbi:MAG: hypothetical protein AAF628_18115 [Planctomycetota bacterium]